MPSPRAAEPADGRRHGAVSCEPWLCCRCGLCASLPQEVNRRLHNTALPPPVCCWLCGCHRSHVPVCGLSTPTGGSCPWAQHACRGVPSIGPACLPGHPVCGLSTPVRGSPVPPGWTGTGQVPWPPPLWALGISIQLLRRTPALLSAFRVGCPQPPRLLPLASDSAPPPTAPLNAFC